MLYQDMPLDKQPAVWTWDEGVCYLDQAQGMTDGSQSPWLDSLGGELMQHENRLHTIPHKDGQADPSYEHCCHFG